jgi:hypothetical protein
VEFRDVFGGITFNKVVGPDYLRENVQVGAREFSQWVEEPVVEEKRKMHKKELVVN